MYADVSCCLLFPRSLAALTAIVRLVLFLCSQRVQRGRRDGSVDAVLGTRGERGQRLLTVGSEHQEVRTGQRRSLSLLRRGTKIAVLRSPLPPPSPRPPSSPAGSSAAPRKTSDSLGHPTLAASRRGPSPPAPWPVPRTKHFPVGCSGRSRGKHLAGSPCTPRGKSSGARGRPWGLPSGRPGLWTVRRPLFRATWLCGFFPRPSGRDLLRVPHVV